MEDEMKKTVLFSLLGAASGALARWRPARSRPRIQGRGSGRVPPMCGGHDFHAMSPEAAKEHLQVAAKWALADVVPARSSSSA
jgi:hypothetical protein